MIRSRGISLAVGAVIMTVYSLTAARGVGFIDSGELATVAWTLGIAHPTGYPLFTLLAWMAAHIPAGIPVIFRLNLFSSVVSAAACVVFFHLLVSVLRRVARGGRTNGAPILAAAGFGTFALAFSKTFWSQATGVEVYPLHALFLVLVTGLFLRMVHGDPESAERGGDRLRDGLLFAYVLGLAFANHMTTLYLAPAFLYLYFRSRGAGRESRRFLLRLVPAFILGLSVYFYLPVRAMAGAVVNWGNPETLGSLIRHLSGKQYSVWIFSSMETAGKQLRYFFSGFGGEFWYLPVILAAWGAIVLFRRNREMMLFVFLLFAGCLAFAVNYDIHDIDSYFLLAYVATAIFAAAGLHGILISAGGGRKGLVVAGIAMLFTAGEAARNLGDCDQSRLKIVEEYTRSILESAEPGGMVISYQWDYFVSASYYLQLVEGVRPDVVVIDKELLRRSWYFVYLERRYPGLVSGARAEVDPFLRELHKFENGLPYDPGTIEYRYTRMIGSFIGSQYGRGPVYVTPEIEPAYTAGYRRVPHGLTFRLFAEGDREEWREVPLAIGTPEPATRLLDGITMLHAQAEFNNAIYLLQSGRSEDAVRTARRAVDVRPDYAEARAFLSRFEGGTP